MPTEEQLLDLALAVGAATQGLNDAIRAAHTAGLVVCFANIEIQYIDRRDSLPLIKVDVSKPLATTRRETK